MHSFIIVGGTSEKRQLHINNLIQTWHINPFDCVRIETDDGSIGIAQIRAFISQLQLTPRQSPLQAGIIPNAELLTIPAQQALLKTLEEPPPSARIVLGIENSTLLLPTILSRCQVISLTSSETYTQKELDDSWKLLASLTTSTLGERISICATLGKTKEELSLFLSKAIGATRQHMRSSETHRATHASLLRALLIAKKYEGTNANLSLIIEHIFLSGNDINIV